MTPEQEIRRRIIDNGPITLSEFIDVALYWPQGGYYATRNPIGGLNGDFYTSPLVHPAFGALLGVQLFQMWQILERPAPFTVIEPGAGNGLLGRDIVNFASGLPGGFADCLQYICIDRRVIRGLESHVKNSHRLACSGLPIQPIRGCVLSNEHLDAFPVHQVVAEQGCLKEVYVVLDNGELVTNTGPPTTPALAERFKSLGISLQDGQTAEVNLSLNSWAKEAATTLERGFVLTIDYGRMAQDLYSPDRRSNGTLTTYHKHLQTDSPLKRIGQQDITAQVDFTSIVDSGQRAGLEPLGFTTQQEFLERLNLAHFVEMLDSRQEEQREIQANRAGMLELIKPSGFGDFKALVQGKNVGQPNLWGFWGTQEARELVAAFDAPMLTPDHLYLTQSRYPNLEMQFAPFWPEEDSLEPQN